MSFLQHISLIQFKNYRRAQFSFSHKISCICGSNGSGKTNLLDAVYYLCYTKSYFSSSQQNNAQWHTEGFRLEGSFTGTQQCEEIIVAKWKQGKKEILCNDSAYDRITDHIGKYAAVMIAPDDIELINGTSELRRKWIDSILCQCDAQYMNALLHYQKILQQRNAWLRQNAKTPYNDSFLIDFYDKELSGSGTYIYEKRKAITAPLVDLVNEYYALLSARKEQAGIQYNSELYQQDYVSLLQQYLQQDSMLQRTTRGIHRDDWDFTLNGIPLKQFASQGQKKSFLFALKLAQYAYLSKTLGFKPMLLLDDVFEKLDQQRMEALLQLIRSSQFEQVLITDTHAQRVQEALGSTDDVGIILVGETILGKDK